MLWLGNPSVGLCLEFVVGRLTLGVHRTSIKPIKDTPLADDVRFESSLVSKSVHRFLF